MNDSAVASTLEADNQPGTIGEMPFLYRRRCEDRREVDIKKILTGIITWFDTTFLQIIQELVHLSLRRRDVFLPIPGTFVR